MFRKALYFLFADQCEAIMPESPETKGHIHNTPVTSPNPMAGGVTPAIRESNRPLSNNTGKRHECIIMRKTFYALCRHGNISAFHEEQSLFSSYTVKLL